VRHGLERVGERLLKLNLEKYAALAREMISRLTIPKNRAIQISSEMKKNDIKRRKNKTM
jgi:hypothetical protein